MLWRRMTDGGERWMGRWVIDEWRLDGLRKDMDVAWMDR